MTPDPPETATTSVLKGKRIIFVLGSLELGGAERQALILARYLSEQEQCEVEVWGFNHSGPAAAICEQHGIAWRVIPYYFVGGLLSRLAGLWRLAKVMRRARPDILLPYTLIPNLVCGLVWRGTGALLCVWNQRDEGILRLSPEWERRAVRMTPQFISNSRQGARFLVNELNAPPAKVALVNNGVECPAPGANRILWRNRLHLDEECFVACMVANLHRHKDHQTLLKAWRHVVATLKASGRGAALLLAGRHDDAYESLHALSHELGINQHVYFLGHVEDIPGLLSAADLCLFSSRSEGCPNGVLEGMAAGLAVAGTEIEALKEAVGPEGAPFLAPAGDADALASIILKLANDPALSSALGVENQNRIRSKYDSRRMCEETVSLLTNYVSAIVPQEMPNKPLKIHTGSSPDAKPHETGAAT